MHLTKVTTSMESGTLDQNAFAALTTHLNDKSFDLDGCEGVCAELHDKFKILKEKLKAVLECEPSLVELKILKEELVSLVGKEQCLFEATRLAEEHGLQKNTITSLGQLLRKTDAEKADLQTLNRNFETLIKNLEQEKKELRAEQRSLAERLYQAQNQLYQTQVQLHKAQARVNTGIHVIQQCHDDIAQDTLAYNYLEAEAEVYKHRGNYYKALCEEAHTLTIEREIHSMKLEDKNSQREHIYAKTHLDRKYMGYENASAALEKIKANKHAAFENIKAFHDSTQKEEISEDPELAEALRLSNQIK